MSNGRIKGVIKPCIFMLDDEGHRTGELYFFCSANCLTAVLSGECSRPYELVTDRTERKEIGEAVATADWCHNPDCEQHD